MISKKKIPIPKTSLVEQLHSADISPLRRYQRKALGDDRLKTLFKYEILTNLLGDLSGGVGYLLRRWFYPRILKSVGNGVVLGKGVVFRYPKYIKLGHNVAIDDYTLLDASGAVNGGVIIEDDVVISRNCIVQGKTGPIRIGKKTDIGCNTIISSVSGINIGHSALIAGNCYIGGGRYTTDSIEIPIMEQGFYSLGPVMIGDGVWLGAGSIVIDGIQIGKGCIVGAGSLVTKDLPDYAVAIGVPAQVIKMRNNNEDGGLINQ